MGKCRAKDFVLSEEKKENRRGDSHDCDDLGKSARIFGHAFAPAYQKPGAYCVGTAYNRLLIGGRVGDPPPHMLLLEYLAVFHHELHVAQLLDVLQGIAGDSNDVSISSGCDDADLSGHVEHVCGA